MDAVIVDYQPIVEKQGRAVVGFEREVVAAGLRNPDIPGVIDGEPLETLRDAREAFVELL